MYSFPATVADDTPYSKTAGEEPLPGYRLLEPLGRGGFGEVWKCVAPGGLQKAVKFVSADPEMTNASSSRALEQEYEAFQQIKLIRHPFLLQLERVELVDGELVMVMELADSQLAERFAQCQETGQPGIPRPELLGYYVDAAEALDHIGRKHGLQHLDIKPANLFILSGHVKVGDYGLVARMEAVPGRPAAAMANRGLTPRYVAPEVLRGNVHMRSDQYSLALVYYELLTGGFPYTARSAQQMMLQHVQAAPDLSRLPPDDRLTVGRALAKNPADRFPSCLAFVQALIVGPGQAITVTPPAIGSAMTDSTLKPTAPWVAATPAPSAARRPAVALTVPGLAVPALVTPGATRFVTASPRTPPETPASRAPAETMSEVSLTLAEATPENVVLNPIESVVTTPRLLGLAGTPATLMADHFIEAMLAAASHSIGGGGIMPGELAVRADGSWACRFPTTLVPSVVPLKLTTLIDEGWCDEVTAHDATTFVLRANGSSGGLFGRRKGGAEVIVKLPTVRVATASMARMSAPSGLSNAVRPGAVHLGGPTNAISQVRETAGVCEVDVTGRIFGTPDPAFARTAAEVLPNLLGEVRKLLMNVDDRRKSPRLAVQAAVTLYPIHDDGTVLEPVAAQTRDVSAGGLCLVAAHAMPTRYVYVEFPEAPTLAGSAILLRLTRSQFTGIEQVLGGRFRTDL